MDDVDLVILGGGATGIEFADHVWETKGHDVLIGVVDDNLEPSAPKWARRNARVLGRRNVLDRVAAPYLVAVGDPDIVAELSAAADRAGLHPAAPVVHPSAVLAPGVRLGDGTVVYPQAAMSTDVAVGQHCQIHLGVTLGHDTQLGDRSILTPGVHVSGDCRLGDDVFVGTGAVVVPGVAIGSGALVGAGSVVTRDLPGDVVAFGSPAEVRRERAERQRAN